MVYQGPGNVAWQQVPDATINEPTDAVVKVDAVTICGTDLHILGGDVPEVTPGRDLGHEAVGTVTEIGSAVRAWPLGRSPALPHHRLRHLLLLPRRRLRAVPWRRRLDPRSPHRRHPG